MTPKILYKTLINLLAAFSICSVLGCTTVEPTVTETLLPTAVWTPSLNPAPTPILDSNALQLWINEESSVNIKARFGIGSVNSLAISPDGNFVAVGSVTGVNIYQFETLKKINTILFELPAKIVEWSPNGGYLAAASGTEVFVFEVSTGEQRYVLSGHRDNVDSIAWSPDSQKLASWALDRHVIVWDSQTGESIRAAEISDSHRHQYLHWTSDSVLVLGPRGGILVSLDVSTGSQSSYRMSSTIYSYVTQVSWSGDDTKLLTGGELGRVFVWDIPSERELLVYNQDRSTASVDSVAWSPDGAYAAAGLRDGTILIWDAVSGVQLKKLNRKLGGNTDTVLDLDWSPDSRYLVSLSRFEPITVWDIQSGEELRSTGEQTSWVLSEAWSPDGTKLATSSEDGVIIIRDAVTGEILQSIVDPVGWVRSLAWSPDGKQLASGTARVTIWDVLSGAQLKILSGHSHGVNDVAWSPDSTMFASGSRDGELFVWDAVTGEQLQTLTDSMGDMYHIEDIVWSSDGDVIGASYTVFPDPNNLVRQVGFWNPKTGEQLQRKSGIEGLEWYPSTDVAVSAYNGRVVMLWRPSSGEKICRLNGKFGGNFAWSPDGKLLASTYDQYSLAIFEAETCAQLHLVQGHGDFISNVEWSPRGDLIVSTSYDGTVIIWEIKAH